MSSSKITVIDLRKQIEHVRNATLVDLKPRAITALEMAHEIFLDLERRVRKIENTRGL